MSTRSARLSLNAAILAAAVAGLMTLVLMRASVSEDAYITFRVVDNAVHGYGLRWNTDDRVQAYTNPLWMLLHIPLYALWGNIFYITIALSVACTLAALIITLRTFRHPWPAALALFILPLAVSPAFLDHSTSGLENPLTHLLFAAFGWALFRAGPKRFWFWLSLCCALSMVNRLDTALVYFPAVAWLAVTRLRTLRFGQCLLGALPIIGWELFSLFYYGFLLPNTAYAKLGAGIHESLYIAQGLHYLVNLVTTQPAPAVFLAAAAIGVPLYRCFRKGKDAVRTEFAFLALGVLLYSAYIIAVGGSHVCGRFWSLPIFASAWILYGIAGDRMPRLPCSVLATLLLLIRLAWPDVATMKYLCHACFAGHIAPFGDRITLRDQIGHGQDLPAVHRDAQPIVKVGRGVGISGYTAGPAAHIVDSFALSDPLLARLPALHRHIRRIGHLYRALPGGYREALATGSPDNMDPSLAAYYKVVRLIDSADLLAPGRLDAILHFNLGDYDYLLVQYLRDSRARGITATSLPAAATSE